MKVNYLNFTYLKVDESVVVYSIQKVKELSKSVIEKIVDREGRVSCVVAVLKLSKLGKQNLAPSNLLFHSRIVAVLF